VVALPSAVRRSRCSSLAPDPPAADRVMRRPAAHDRSAVASVTKRGFRATVKGEKSDARSVTFLTRRPTGRPLGRHSFVSGRTPWLVVGAAYPWRRVRTAAGAELCPEFAARRWASICSERHAGQWHSGFVSSVYLHRGARHVRPSLPVSCVPLGPIMREQRATNARAAARDARIGPTAAFYARRACEGAPGSRAEQGRKRAPGFAPVPGARREVHDLKRGPPATGIRPSATYPRLVPPGPIGMLGVVGWSVNWMFCLHMRGFRIYTGVPLRIGVCVWCVFRGLWVFVEGGQGVAGGPGGGAPVAQGGLDA
jgi:hypothetical protein